MVISAVLLVASAISPATAQPAPDGPLSRLAAQVAGLGVTGRITERLPGSYLFVPEAPNLPALPIANPERVSGPSVGPTLWLKGTVDAAANELLVEEYTLALADAARRTSARAAAPAASPMLQATSERVQQVVDAFAATVSEALRPGAMSVEDLRRSGSSPVAQGERRAEGDLAALYREAVTSGDSRLRGATVRATAEIRQELKAIYGEYDNYPPWSYERLYGNTKSVVAIGVAGRPQPICSGVLVADDLVLTAGHCLKESLPTDLEVWFNFVETASASSEPVRFAVEELVAPDRDRHAAFLERAERETFDRSLMDFALLRFERPPGSSLPDGVAPQCLRKPSIGRGTPLYVVGYPKGARATVHDNGRVYLPFSVRKTQLEDLRREIEVDFVNLADAERLAILDQFTASYEPDTDSGSTVFHLFDLRYGGQPKIGIIADTFRGNSGSPVYDRDGRQCVVGILIGGAPDTGARLPANWQQHESVLPISAIRDDLLAHPATAALISGVLDFR